MGLAQLAVTVGWHRGIKVMPFLVNAVKKGRPEVVQGPVAFAVARVWRDVAGIDRTQRTIDYIAARKGEGTDRGMAGDTATKPRCVFARSGKDDLIRRHLHLNWRPLDWHKVDTQQGNSIQNDQRVDHSQDSAPDGLASGPGLGR